MRRSRNNTSNDVIIDLTSLLDVIFIVLLVVMVNNKISAIDQQEVYEQQQAQLTEEQQLAEDAQKNANNAAQLYNDMIQNEKDLSKYILMISVSAPYNEDEPRKRQINKLVEGGEIETFDLIGSDQTPFDEFRESIKKDIEEFSENHPETVIILCLNDDNGNILYRDEKMITSILNEFSESEKNVYLKGHLYEDD